MADSFWSSLKTRLKGAFAKRDLNFEAKWVVSVDELQISCKRPNGVIESVAWRDLHLIGIATTDQGPHLPDVFWYLIGGKGACIVPQGATGEDAMLEKIQQLPGFDNEAVIKAMTSTTNNRFICWQRSGGR
jgi:hypothetical protein